jgi:cell division protein FtsQ
MKKGLMKIGIFLSLIGFFILVSFAKSEQEKGVVQEVVVSIDVTKSDPFMDEEDIKSLVYARQDTLKGKPIKDLYLNDIEVLLEKESSVRNAEVYVQHNSDVHLDIQLKKVLARIKPDTTTGFYIDQQGGTMKWLTKYAPRVLTVTGHLHKYNRFLSDTLVEKELSTHSKLIKDVFQFAEFVNKDSFWKSQIGQVFINKKGDAVIIPLLGSEEFIFGELTNYEIKFNKIKRYYEEIAPKMGWDKYQEVNVKFEKQIVCK